ncbi:MAG: SufD family Fe-S cluster assembly protein [Candidatus Eremiobacteraeota bacterium]|nr:SufD family Fe-S cluster assembly protein [Candidatus Eremiobacteraeota bacterium]
MSASSDTAVRGVSRAALEALLGHLGEGSIPASKRFDALARFAELPARSSVRGGRTWKYDLAKLDLSQLATFASYVDAEVDLESLSVAARRAGVTIERFSVARERHRVAFDRAFGKALDTRDDTFASLALAFQNHGTFVDVPAGTVVDEPLVIGYEAREEALFPYTLVSLGDGARATILERVASIEGDAFACGLTEIVLGERAHLSYSVEQRTSGAARCIATRRALLAANAELDFAVAELGAKHTVSRFRSVESSAGGRTGVVAVFFSDGDQHVDIETETVHAAPNTTSDTVVRSAGTGRGQGRYLGNIKILAQAHGAEASLRDDALLLSEGAHIDSIPALEIAANDVKAFHGATIGAISDEELFYAESRGIERSEAERMIALGFFEPAVARFPTDDVRGEIRRALERKIAPAAAGAGV